MQFHVKLIDIFRNLDQNLFIFLLLSLYPSSRPSYQFLPREFKGEVESKTYIFLFQLDLSLTGLALQ